MLPRQTWLARFHAGDRQILDGVYRDHVDGVNRAVSGVLEGADRETVVHEIFLRLMSTEGLRAAFQGGDLGAWLSAIARNHAIDYARRRRRECPVGLGVDERASAPGALAGQAEARMLIDRFVRDVLPAKWRRVFEARFLDSLSQTEAASALRMNRTTLVYQELRIRGLLRAFLLEDAS